MQSRRTILMTMYIILAVLHIASNVSLYSNAEANMTIPTRITERVNPTTIIAMLKRNINENRYYKKMMQLIKSYLGLILLLI